jgi:hypothetical protein
MTEKLEVILTVFSLKTWTATQEEEEEEQESYS